MSRISIYTFSLILLHLLVSAGCSSKGGGSGQSSAAANQHGAAPGGLYFGTLSHGFIHNTLVLDKGQYYVFYGVSTTASLKLAGFIQGSATNNNEKFVSSDLKDFFWDGSVSGGTLNATYTGSAFNGTLGKKDLNIYLTGTPLASAFYNYDVAPNIPDIAGAWTLTSLAGAATTMKIDPNGTFTGNTGRCTYTGTLAPRASGKNVFDVSLTFGGSPCSEPGLAVTGAAIDFLLSDGVTRQLIMAGVTATREQGTAIFGTRSPPK